MWLLDANISRKVKFVLNEFGVSCSTAQERGWGTLKNGELVARAVENGFSVLLTQDTLFLESASKTLKKHPEFALVLVRIRQVSGRIYTEIFREAYASAPVQPQPGKLIEWP